MTKRRKHPSHNSAMESFRKTIAHASGTQKVVATRRLKFETRLDEYVQKTIERYEVFKKRGYNTKYFLIHNRDEKKWIICRKINRKEDMSFGSEYRREAEELMAKLRCEEITWEEALDRELQIC